MVSKSNSSYRRVSTHPLLPNSYIDRDDERRGGHSPLHHALDDYLEEKGIDFDIAMRGRQNTAQMPDGKVIMQHVMSAIVMLGATNIRLVEEVIVPGLTEIAKRYECRIRRMPEYEKDLRALRESQEVFEVIPDKQVIIP
jgi:hypothetical protein